jgi:hypothetical protein
VPMRFCRAWPRAMIATEFVMASAKNIDDFQDAFANTRLFPTEQPARCCQASGWRATEGKRGTKWLTHLRRTPADACGFQSS